jgi:hypothetical protein
MRNTEGPALLTVSRVRRNIVAMRFHSREGPQYAKALAANDPGGFVT